MKSVKQPRKTVIIESEINVNAVKFRVKSVFTDKIELKDALANIANKKKQKSDLPVAG